MHAYFSLEPRKLFECLFNFCYKTTIGSGSVEFDQKFQFRDFNIFTYFEAS